ncbi:conserved hypothetical protein [Sporisorium reilianum SRZ2]|uniref:Uncharacterized protein n=1 Tax=Sporisorium reilianum (strain SRZ2) TaxID=999809 RepID=E6ZPS4_SPORE|nr:conserved hypothetical protein [Sporisorium reilianum SRZ2]
MFHASSTRLNAAGLAPEHSKLLPERQPKDDEAHLLQLVHQLYTSATPSDECFSLFANEAILTLPTGDVVVGPNGVKSKFAEILAPFPQRTLRQRLLVTPESLPHRTIVLDHMLSLSSDDGQTVKNVHSLVVIKRKAQDGKISSLIEEEGHRKATAPLAARAAAANSFYSPTDAQLSPVTSKLNLAKKKHHMKAKPTALFANRSGWRQAIIPGSPAHSTGTSAEMEF